MVNCLSDKAEHLRRDRHLSWFHIVKKHGDSDEKDEAMCLVSGDEQYTSSMSIGVAESYVPAIV